MVFAVFLLSGTYQGQIPGFLLAGFCFLLFSFQARRHILFWGISLVPIIADSFSYWIEHRRTLPFIRRRLNSGVAILATLLLLLFYVQSSETRFGLGLEKERYPLQSSRYLSQVVLPAMDKNGPLRVFNGQPIGGFLIHALYPRIQVYIDGRTRLYGEALHREYSECTNDISSLKELLEEEKIDLVWLPFHKKGFICPVIDSLVKDRDWNLLFFDDVSLVSARPGFIEQLEQRSPANTINLETLNPLDYSVLTDTRLEDTIGKLNHFHEKGWGGFRSHHYLGTLYARRHQWEKAIREYQAALEVVPNSVDVLYNLANTYRIMGEPDLAIPIYRQSLKQRKSWPEAKNNLGLAYLLAGQLEKAKVLYPRSSKRSSGQPSISI